MELCPVLVRHPAPPSVRPRFDFPPFAGILWPPPFLLVIYSRAPIGLECVSGAATTALKTTSRAELMKLRRCLIAFSAAYTRHLERGHVYRVP